MLTARGTSDIVEGLDVGADDYLAKPFSFEYCWRVCSMLRRPNEEVGRSFAGW